MSTKIVKAGGATPDSFELSVAQQFADLEAGSAEWKADLNGLNISAAKELDLDGGRKAIIIFVPFRQLKDFHKAQPRLSRELEKKFNGRHVVFVAQRTILPKTFNRSAKQKGPRSRSRTLTAVHEAILEDIVHPTEIVGKRIRYKVDGSKILKVFLDPKDLVNVETKIDTFSIDADGILSVSAVEKAGGKTHSIQIKNDRGRSQEEIDRMVAEAEGFKADDDAQLARIAARNGLEQYAYQVKQSLEDEQVAGKASAEDRAAVKAKVDETLSWLDANQAAEKDEYEHAQKELEAVVGPVMAKIHGAGGAGAPPAAGPASCAQEAGPGFAAASPRTVEEVD